MLRINLLPAYIAERRKVRLAIILSVLLFLGVTGAGLGYNFGPLATQVKDITDKDATDTTTAQEEQAYEAETASILTKLIPLGEKVNFVDLVRFYNLLPGKIYRNAARYTYRKVEYTSMAAEGTNLALSANVSSLDDIGRFYLTMFGNPDVTAVSIAGVPDWKQIQAAQPIVIPGGPPPAPPQYHIGMNATLVMPVVAPTLPASLSAAPGGAAGAPGAPGAPAAGPAGPAAMSTGGPPPRI